MSISVRQTNVKAAFGGSSTTVNCSDMPGNLISGSVIIVALTFETQTVSGVSVSDNKNAGNYTADGDSGALAGNSGAGGGRILFFHQANTYSGVGTGINFTANWTTGSPGVMTIYEVSGVASNPFDKTATAKTGTGTLTALGYSISPTNSGSLVVCCGLSNSPTGIAVDTNYTFPTGDQGSGTIPIGETLDYHSHEYYANATGSQSLNFQGTGSGGASIFAAAYAPPVTVTYSVAWITA